MLDVHCLAVVVVVNDRRRLVPQSVSQLSHCSALDRQTERGERAPDFSHSHCASSLPHALRPPLQSWFWLRDSVGSIFLTDYGILGLSHAQSVSDTNRVTHNHKANCTWSPTVPYPAIHAFQHRCCICSGCLSRFDRLTIYYSTHYICRV